MNNNAIYSTEVRSGKLNDSLHLQPNVRTLISRHRLFTVHWNLSLALNFDPPHTDFTPI